MKQVHKKHPQAIRWMHWINFPVLFLMIWSGLLIYWANDVYRVGTGIFTLFQFFPEHFYKFLGVDHRLAEGMALHFFFMWFFAFNGVAYLLYTVISGEWRHLVPTHNHRLPVRKYKRAQQVAYTCVILMGAGSFLTGISIYKPVQFAWLTTLLGGYEYARWEHFLLTVGYCLFFVGHVTQVIRAGWNNLRAMLTGYELVTSDPAPSCVTETSIEVAP